MMANKSHWQPKVEKTYKVQSILESVRNLTRDKDVDLPSLSKMTARDLGILEDALADRSAAHKLKSSL